jgi:uncharacterized membrane protein
VTRRVPAQADRAVPSWEDPVVRAASTAVGGPWGRHGLIGRNYFWTPLRVCLAFTLVVLALSWFQKSPCRSGAWSDNLQYTHMCYSDVIPLYYTEGMDTHQVPYADHAVEYPVLTGYFMYAARTLSGWYDRLAGSGDAPKVNPVESYFDVTALLLALCALVVTWAVYLLAGRRGWDAAMVALSPVLFVHAFTNWDLFAVALSTAALVAWHREIPWLAGVLIGLGAAAKLYPALFAIPVLLLCLRARRMYEFSQFALAGLAAWLAVNLPILLRYRHSWLTFYTNNRTRPADPDSLWNLLQYLRGTPLDTNVAQGGSPTILNLAVAVATIGVVCGVGGLALAARRRPRLPQLLFLLVAGFLLVNKVWSPQYSLWLVPLAVLARPSWRAILAWQATEAFLWFPRMYWYLGSGNKGLDEHWFLLAVVIRDVAVLALATMIVRDILQPEYDVVRLSGMDDPAGGVLDGAADSSEGSWSDDWSGSLPEPVSLSAPGSPPESASRSDVDEIDWSSPGSYSNGDDTASGADRNST